MVSAHGAPRTASMVGRRRPFEARQLYDITRLVRGYSSWGLGNLVVPNPPSSSPPPFNKMVMIETYKGELT